MKTCCIYDIILWNNNNVDESLNSGGHQFYQYQQNEQSPLILTMHQPECVNEKHPFTTFWGFV